MDIDFIYDLSMGIASLEEVKKIHKVTDEQYDKMLEDPVFTQLLAESIHKHKEEGLTVQKKARALLEMHLPTLSALLTDSEVNANAKVGMFRELAEMAGEKRKDAGKNTGSGFNLTIHPGTNDESTGKKEFGLEDVIQKNSVTQSDKE